MQNVKSGDYIFNSNGKLGIVVCVYEENNETKVQYLLENDYNYKTTSADSVIVIPRLQFANFPVALNKVKPGSLVQIVSSGNFCHITCFNTAASGAIYIETTDNAYSTFHPSELNFIG